MINKGLVSIIMPVYNGMPLIEASIKSLLNQTYTNWECIIVNDGSTDKTEKYIDTLDKSKFIIHNFKRNLGRPHARQKGLDLAKGEFVAMLDAEDLYHKEKLELQVNTLNRYPEIFLVGCGMCSFGTGVDFIRVRAKGTGNIHTYFINDKFPVAHGPSMIRKEHAIKFEYNLTLKLGEDIDYLKKYLNGKKYINLSDVFYYYSEFDSVTKRKIKNTYRIYLKNYFVEREFKKSIISLFKLMISYLIHPFMNINTILKNRGDLPSKKELNDYQKYCLPILQKINKP